MSLVGWVAGGVGVLDEKKLNSTTVVVEVEVTIELGKIRQKLRN